MGKIRRGEQFTIACGTLPNMLWAHDCRRYNSVRYWIRHRFGVFYSSTCSKSAADCDDERNGKFAFCAIFPVGRRMRRVEFIEFIDWRAPCGTTDARSLLKLINHNDRMVRRMVVTDSFPTKNRVPLRAPSIQRPHCLWQLSRVVSPARRHPGTIAVIVSTNNNIVGHGVSDPKTKAKENRASVFSLVVVVIFYGGRPLTTFP